MTDPLRQTLKVYDEKAQTYTDMVAEFDDPAFEAFVADIPKGGHILDLGCGPGHVAARFADQGFQVTALDGSAEMVRRAAAHPGVSARQATFDEISGEDIYDGLWASFSLLHAPKSRFPHHLKALRRAARPGARLHLAMKLGDGEGPDSLGRYYAYYTQETLYDLLKQSGFSPKSHFTGTAPGLSGSNDPWIAIAAYA
ncbi:MAG: class I SAM-dependent methyltransferase [Arenibacterium sp.]